MWQSYGSGEASPHRPISVSGIVRELIKGLSSIATQNGVKLTSEIAQDPCTLLGNSVQVTRAIQNVIVNAIQAAGETKGAVTVSCERKEFYVDVRVRDAGPGMSAEQLQKIFEPYFTTKQNKSGTGLGLYITKKVVEDHNGSIKVESVQGTGTTMTIRLPLENK
jgi:signal transduction histidine kinase